MYLGIATIVISAFPVAFSSGVMTLGKGNFTVIGEPIVFNAVINMGTGIFNVTGGNIGIYSGSSSVIDALAADAPYPPPDFFVPVTDGAPPVVLSPDVVFGQGSTDPDSPIFMSYYDQVTQVWDDIAFTSQYPGEVIPPGLKLRVSDQTYLYDTYIAAKAIWDSNYAQQKIYQWPYYWALNVGRATGSTAGSSDGCGCGSGITLSPDTVVAATQNVLGGTSININDTFDIGGTHYTVGQMFAMVLKNLAQP